MKPDAYIEIGPGPSPIVDRPIEVCPTCKAGRLEKGVASMPNECCAIYFCGAGSEMHMQWKWQAMSPEERARKLAARDKLAAERMAAAEDGENELDALRAVASAALELLRANNERSGPFESRAEDAAWSKLAIALDGLGEDK